MSQRTMAKSSKKVVKKSKPLPGAKGRKGPKQADLFAQSSGTAAEKARGGKKGAKPLRSEYGAQHIEVL
jgi:hypothetical protein